MASVATHVGVSLAGLCRFANQAIHGEVARRMAEAGYGAIRPPHFPVFRALNNEPGGLSLSRLAEEIKLSKPTVKEVVDYLVREGYLERSPHPTDRRILLVRLKPQGRQFTATCWPIVAAVEAEVEALVGADDLVTVRAALTKLAAAFGSDLAQGEQRADPAPGTPIIVA
jgi:DNA-binding MarR family transcriptional regulator